MDRRMVKPALIGGILLAVVSAVFLWIPLLQCLCCVWIIGAGVLAAYLYIKDAPSPVTLGKGTGLGLLTGFFGSIVMTLFITPFFMIGNFKHVNFAEMMKQSMDQAPNMTPESRQVMEAFLAREGSGTILLLFALSFLFVFFCLFSMLGGTIGVALFEKRKIGSSPFNGSTGEPPAAPPAIPE
jgi:hypothetical protein